MAFSNKPYNDRADAGRRLATLLQNVHGEPLVLALPRGGVVVAREVALALDAPLDVIVTRKLGAPGNPEQAVGALAPGGVLYLDKRYRWDEQQLTAAVTRERAEMERRIRRYGGGTGLPDVKDRTVILVDDGIATGLTAVAALRALQQANVGTLILAVPVCPPDTATQIKQEVDDFVCPLLPSPFLAVGHWYTSFDPVSDEDVIACLNEVQTQRTRSAERNNE